MSRLYIVLVHAPVYNKNMEVITSSVTNLDIHDIARCAATYGARAYYIVHPSPAQQDLTHRIMAFWQEGVGAAYNPHRNEALACVRVVATLDEVRADIAAELSAARAAGITQASRLYTVATDARLYPNTIDYKALRAKMEADDEAYALIFGTGWGLVREEMERADYILQPIYGPSAYNHLSVRSAVAIILDRLCGK